MSPHLPPRPPVQTAASVLDFIRVHNPVLAITWCTQNPSEYQALSGAKRELLITLAQEHQMPHEAWLLSCLNGPISERQADRVETPEPKQEPQQHYHPMRTVLVTIKTTRNLCDLLEEQLFIAQDYLSDMVGSADDPSISETDELLIDHVSTKLTALNDGLGNLSEHYRNLAGMV